MAAHFDYQLAKQRPSWHPPFSCFARRAGLVTLRQTLFDEAMFVNPAPEVKKAAA
jgi:hypothetical protein